MIYFYLPDFYYFYGINMTLCSILNVRPEVFTYGDMKIGGVYGCFPKQIWNGGRVVDSKAADVLNIQATLADYRDMGIPVRFTYTNCLLEESHLDDVHCNFITDVAYKMGNNEILVNSKILENYLRDKYPNFKYISSATRCIRDIDKLNELAEGDMYYLVLGDYRDNFDFDYLSKIENKEKFEILIDPWCKLDCKMRELHYKIVSQKQLGIEEDSFPGCNCQDKHWFDVEKSDSIIKSVDLQKYIDMGFKHFKLEGRNMHPVDVIDSYVYYLIKPEYQNEVRNLLLKNYYVS